MWKVIVTAGIACVAGVTAGWAFFRFNTSQVREGFYDGQWAATGSSQPGQNAKLYLKSGSLIDLGVIYTGHRYQHEILIENVGHEVGSFWLAGTPPASIQLDFAPQEIQRIGPRSTYPILISCSPTQVEEPYRKVIVLPTSQTDRTLTLTVTGQVQAGVLVAPQQLHFEVSGAEPAPMLIDVCAWRGEDLSRLQVTGAPDWFDVALEPIEESELAKKYPGATQGRRVKVQLHPEAVPDVEEVTLTIDLQQRDLVPWPVKLSISRLP
ncbi:MAG TPA: hypothetical protein PKD54_09030 [Pirellulaceae bacterium]|nr:hypothetical protein [Pirellulaceae bacterium]